MSEIRHAEKPQSEGQQEKHSLGDIEICLENNLRRAAAKSAAALLAGMAISNLCAPNIRTQGHRIAPHAPSHKIIQPSRLPMTMKEASEEAKRGWEALRSGRGQLSVVPTFIRNDSSGAHAWLSPHSLVEPLQLQITEQAPVSRETTFTIPAKYAENFDQGDPVRKQDYNQASSYVRTALKEASSEEVHGLPASRFLDSQTRQASSRTPLSLDSLSIEGTSSFEGSNALGIHSVDPNRVDPENIELAKLRAESAKSLVQDSLKRLGVAHADVTIPVSAKEIQPTKAEWKLLTTLAKGYPGSNEQEKVLQLVSQYNAGTLSPSVQKQVDPVLGQKRGVEVSLKYSGKNTERFIIPLPLGLLLLGGLGLRRRARVSRRRFRPNLGRLKPTMKTWKPSLPSFKPSLPVIKPKAVSFKVPKPQVKFLELPKYQMDWGKLAFLWKQFKFPWFKVRIQVERGEWSMRVPTVDRENTKRPTMKKVQAQNSDNRG